MDRLYPYTRRLVRRARLQRRSAGIALLGVAACVAVFALAGRTGTPAGALHGSVPAPLELATVPAVPAKPGPRLVYPYSIVPGGVAGPAELAQVIRTDKVVAAHYASFDLGKARAVTLATPRAVHVSYRKGDQVYWTSKKVMLAAGETLLSDGKQAVRARCANRISDIAMFPVEAEEPTADILDSVVEEQAGAVDGDAGSDGLLLASADGADAMAHDSGHSGYSDWLAQAAFGPSGSGITFAAPGMTAMTLSQSGSSASQGPIYRPAAAVPLRFGASPPALLAAPPTPAVTAPAGGNAGDAAGDTPVAPASPATPTDSAAQAPADSSTDRPPAGVQSQSGVQAPGGGTPGSGSGSDGNMPQSLLPRAPAPGNTSTTGTGKSPGPFIPEPGMAPPLPPAETGSKQPEATPVPEPASGWLAAAALIAMALLSTVRRSAPGSPGPRTGKCSALP